ncbi:MAG: protease complex subunit PrcB family protein [Gammaproteobacteria bacterium]|nr:protease complex subunit PrcB family protein [Gammaproteobacteria bacterium]
MAVIFTLGAQRSGGYSVQITRAIRTAENLKLIAEVSRPSPDCIVTAAITAPADVVLLPMTKKPVVVEEISVLVDC